MEVFQGMSLRTLFSAVSSPPAVMRRDVDVQVGDSGRACRGNRVLFPGGRSDEEFIRFAKEPWSGSTAPDSGEKLPSMTPGNGR